MAGSPTFLSDGHTPRRTDAIWAIEQKILGALVDDAGGGAPDGSGFVTSGNGVPSAPPADPTRDWLYTDLDTGILYPWVASEAAWRT